MIDMDNPTFPLSAASAAVGWNLTTLRNYFANGVFEWLDVDLRAEKQGSKSLVSLRTVYRLGVTYDLWNLGVPPKDAFNAAGFFTEFGAGSKFINQDLTRLPGELFPWPFRTVLVWRAENYRAEVLPVKRAADLDIDSLFDAMGMWPNAPAGAVAIVNINRVVDSINIALKVDA